MDENAANAARRTKSPLTDSQIPEIVRADLRQRSCKLYLSFR